MRLIDAGLVQYWGMPKELTGIPAPSLPDDSRDFLRWASLQRRVFRDAERAEVLCSLWLCSVWSGMPALRTLSSIAAL